MFFFIKRWWAQRIPIKRWWAQRKRRRDERVIFPDIHHYYKAFAAWGIPEEKITDIKRHWYWHSKYDNPGKRKDD